MIKFLDEYKDDFVIVDMYIAEDTLTIRSDKDKTYKFVDDGQDCCEHRYMSCDDDLDYLIGSRFICAELRDGPPLIDTGDEVHEQQFLVVQTDRGSFIVVNHNEHNGWYGGFSISLEVD